MTSIAAETVWMTVQRRRTLMLRQTVSPMGVYKIINSFYCQVSFIYDVRGIVGVFDMITPTKFRILGNLSSCRFITVLTIFVVIRSSTSRSPRGIWHAWDSHFPSTNITARRKRTSSQLTQFEKQATKLGSDVFTKGPYCQ